MQLDSIGFIINLTPFSDKDLIAKIFTKDFGVISGIIKSGQIKKNKTFVGNFGNVFWIARIDTQLGIFHFEEKKNLIAKHISVAKSSFVISNLFELINSFLPEREQYQELFNDTLNFIETLELNKIEQMYLNWEINFLKNLGYAIDVSKCCNCGNIDKLKYISPKTGRAVCENCGKIYDNKLLKMPVSLDTTKRLLENISLEINKPIPVIRNILKF